MAIETATPQSNIDATAPQSRELPASHAGTGASEPALVLDELLVEDVSIDGMCGVY